MRPRLLGTVAGPAEFLFAPNLAAVTLAQSPGPGLPRNGSTLPVTLPPSQDGERIDGMNNPNRSSFPTASSNLPRGFRNRIGYQTYIQFMMDFGRDRSPDVGNTTNASSTAGTKVALSALSPHCPWHEEDTAGGRFSFPPREQPTHSVRRALIAAMQIVREQNRTAQAAIADRVSIITYDGISTYQAPAVAQALTNDYTTAMRAATRLQACGDIGQSTATEHGVITAQNHLRPTTEGGQGRLFTTKVLVTVTDGMPNITSSSSGTINGYISSNPDSDYYASGYDWFNGVLMQASQFRGKKGQFYPIGMGLGADYDFMDRLARVSGTADQNGRSPRSSGNPAEYEQQLTDIFREIIQNPGVRLVQ